VIGFGKTIGESDEGFGALIIPRRGFTKKVT
jgi:hypothetical protein